MGSRGYLTWLLQRQGKRASNMTIPRTDPSASTDLASDRAHAPASLFSATTTNLGQRRQPVNKICDYAGLTPFLIFIAILLAFFFNWHSQNRSTVHPRFRNSRLTAKSRFRLCSILDRQ
jgi:hypothetical protein